MLFTDIVRSTEKAAELGDRDWRHLIERHHETVRRLLAMFHGVEVDAAGDGFFATFDGPTRAVRCALEIVRARAVLGIEVRAGVHTGEMMGGKAVRIAVVIGALARQSEVLVSRTVKDLVAGSDLTLEDAGEHELKGVPERRRLYRVVSESL